jgi:hypothetical protein
MNDEIIEMAIKAGGTTNGKIWAMYPAELETFAKLAAAKEREACAKLAEEYGTWGGSNFKEWFDKLATEIRSKK